jgi:hypothetical protein
MKTTKMTILISLVILLLCGIPTFSMANELIFEGTLNDAEGRPVADGSHFFDFTIFTSAIGGTTLWAESHNNVNIEQGHYSIILGSRTALDLPAGAYWVETTVDGEVLQPRAKVLLADGDCTITNNLMVDGRIGVGTANPGYPIHIDQGDVASGFRTYYGPSCSNCFGEIKQAQADGLIINSHTGGSFAEIRFQNNSVTNMFLRSNGNLGIGTDAPDTKLEVWGDGRFGDWNQPATIQGAKLQIHNSNGTGRSFLVTDFGFPSNTAFVIEGGGDVGIGIENPTHKLDVGVSGAYCDGGAWVNGSSRSFKENITDLSSEEALETLADLQPTSFNYKTDSEETYLGFIAEDVPDLVATKDRKGLVAMDIVAVLTKVVQTQQEQIRVLEESLEALHATR